MAKKYIDPDKIDFRLPYFTDTYGDALVSLSAVRAAIAQTPGEDVVEVVRCRDCKYFGKDIGYGKHDCKKYEMPFCLDNDFCSYGEKKEQA